MLKQEYLTNTYRRLEGLVSEPAFQDWRAQVRARAIQEELLPEQPNVGFTFNARRVERYCDYIFSESDLLAREHFGDKDILLGWIKNVAETFEFLARFSERDEKESLLLNAAMCYHIAGYQANAQCLAKLIERDCRSGTDMQTAGDSTEAILTRQFRLALVSFLRRDIPKLYQVTADSLSSIYGLQETVTKGIAEGALPAIEAFNLMAHAYFQQALSDLVHYCLNGDVDRFAVARKSIQKSHEYFQKVGDATLGAITSELRTVFDLFDARSTWSNISRYAGNLREDRVWQAYLKNLAFEESIVEFWLSQLKAIRRGLLTSEDSFVVQMPTSAGKTLVAELSILAALTAKDRARCLYIAPYRALVHEIQNEMARTLGAVGLRVSTLLGGFEFDAFQDLLIRESDVLIATPEKVELLFRTHPEYFERLSVVVIDEGHILDEGIPLPEELDEGKSLVEELNQQGILGRGTLLELLITRLKRKCADARFIFLSAVMPEINARDFVEWLSKNRQEPLRIAQEERPSRQLIARFEWETEQNGTLEYISLPELPNGRSPFVPYFIARQQYLTGELTPRERQPKRISWPNTDNKAQSAAMLATRFAKTGPTLVFCAQTRDARTVINNVVTSLKYMEASDQLPNDGLKYVENPELESFYLAKKWLGDTHSLTKALHHGVGLHYGPLPDPVRQAVEDEFRSGKIQILVSTNTLGQGVNMPVKTVIVYSLERRWVGDDEHGVQQVHTQKVKKRDFWNICGRAGRAGKETEGQVVFVVISPEDETLLQEFTDYANLEEINSALFNLLQALVERRISQDDLVGYLDSHILAILAEEVVDTSDEAAIRNWLGTSLVGVQALRRGVDLTPLASAIRSASAWVVNQVTDAPLRQVFASTGLRVKSCMDLEKAVDQLLKNITAEFLAAEKDNLEPNGDLLQIAFRACQDLPEMRLRNTVDYCGPEDEFEIIRNWIAGKPISDLRSELWDPEQSETFSEYIADRVTYKLPWGFNGFFRILAFKLQKKYEELPMAWQHLPSMVKFGVNSVVACWANSLGVSSRELALRLAAKYREYQAGRHLTTSHPSFSDFVKWIANLPPDFTDYELDGVDEFEKRRLSGVITQIVSDREPLLFIRGNKGELESPVRGIPYGDRHIAASSVRVGDRLVLQAEPDNPHDPYAIRVLLGDKHIGYVQRDKARILSREMSFGRQVQAFAKTVKPATTSYPFPWIELTIKLGQPSL